MTISDLLTTPVTIIRRAESETYGYDPTYDESTIVTLGDVQQQSRREAEGVVGVSDWVLFLPPDVQIDTNDVVLVGGTRFEVIGDAWKVIDPIGQVPHHIEASLKRISGEGA